MENRRENPAFSWRRFLRRVLTVLLFFYLCADVSVLEYFGGNVSLGIASFREVIEVNPQPAKTSQAVLAQKTIDASRSSKRDRESEIPFDGDDCFCCSSHAAISYNYLIVSLVPITHRQQRKLIFFNSQNHSDWHLPPFYRPPRIA